MKKDRKTILLVIMTFLFLAVSYKCYLSDPLVALSSFRPRNEVQLINPTDQKISTKDLTLIDEYNIDVDNDQKEEKIELYTEAQKDANGEMMWNDGQNWLLLVKDINKTYILFNGYVSIGTIKFWVYTEGINNQLHITTLQASTADMLLTDYIFNSEKDCFEKEITYGPKSVNMLHSPTL